MTPLLAVLLASAQQSAVFGARIAVPQANDDSVWCGCEPVRRAKDCSRARSLSLYNDTAFLCCAWYPRGGHGKPLPKVGSESLASLQGRPRSLSAADTDAAPRTADASWEQPADVYWQACHKHIRTSRLATASEQSCGLPDQCQAGCCCSTTSDFSALTRERHAGVCASPEQCKASGGHCLEKATPRLQDLRRLRNSGYKWSRLEEAARAVSHSWYTAGSPGVRLPPLRPAEAGACMLKRKVGLAASSGGVLAFGTRGAAVADAMTAFHWDVHYKTSPYRVKIAEAIIFGKDKEPLHSIPWTDECFKGDKLFEKFVRRWGFKSAEKMRVEQKHLGTASFGRSPHFTFVITANVDGYVEMRFARNQVHSGNFLGNLLLDFNAKHALLGRGQDFVLYAGEARVQLTPAAVDACLSKGDVVTCLQKKLKSSKHAMLVLDNDSGTFKASASRSVRRKVHELLRTAFGFGRINVCSIPGLVDDDQEKEAGGPCKDVDAVRAEDITQRD